MSTEVGESDADVLTDYAGPDGEILTVGGETNKLAANIGLGRSHAGVNFRSDYEQSLMLGEEVAIGVLRDQRQLSTRVPVGNLRGLTGRR